MMHDQEFLYYLIEYLRVKKINKYERKSVGVCWEWTNTGTCHKNAYGRKNILVASGENAHIFCFPKIVFHLFFYFWKLFVFLNELGQTVSEVLTKFIGSWNLPDLDSRKWRDDRCTILSKGQAEYAERESVGGKTNIYFCSIAQHGSIICWEMLHDHIE